MQSAYKLTLSRIETKARQRKCRNDKKAKEYKLDKGCGVVLRKRVKGHNKSQDVWHSTPYSVVDRVVILMHT